MKKKISNIFRTTFGEETGQDIKHELKVDRDSQLKMANAKKTWLIEYQDEREKKREYIRQKVSAEGLDESKLLSKLQESKGSIIPSIDDFDMEALKNVVEELMHEFTIAKDDDGSGQIDSSTRTPGENGGSGDNTDVQSHLALFDKLQAKEDQELDDSVSSVRSSNSFRSVSTRKGKLTILNQKAFAQIYVSDVYQLITSKIGKMVRSQSLMIVMQSYPMNWKVQRLDIDFLQLRNYLIKKYPQVIIPPLPLVNQKKKLSRKQLTKKKLYYQKFLTSVMKSKVLRGCKFLVDFLKEQDQYKFGYDLSVKEQSRGPRRVKQIKTLTGEVLCEASDMAKNFTTDFNAFNQEYQRINGQISKRCKHVELMSKNLAHSYFGLSTELDNLQKLILTKTEIPQFASLYERISELMRMQGELAIHQGFMVNDKLNGQFKYQREQGRTSFQEAFLLVQGSEYKFQRASKILEAEKYKLFKKQDYESWEVQDPALIKELYKVRNNYEEAKHLMLPQRTQQVQELLDESQYFKQQLFNEVRRIVMLDYFASRENFLEVGEQYANHQGKNLKKWTEFIRYYSDINNARKEKDDQYRKEQYVGEELDWKMLADNLTLFESQIEDLKDLRGFDDPDNTMMMNQSIMQNAQNGDPFNADTISEIPGQRSNSQQPQQFQRSNSMSNNQFGRQDSMANQNQMPNMSNQNQNYQNQQMGNDFKPHPGMNQNNQDQFQNQMNQFNRQQTQQMPSRGSMREPRTQQLFDQSAQEPLLGGDNNMLNTFGQNNQFQQMNQGMNQMQNQNLNQQQNLNQNQGYNQNQQYNNMDLMNQNKMDNMRQQNNYDNQQMNNMNNMNNMNSMNNSNNMNNMNNGQQMQNNQMNTNNMNNMNNQMNNMNINNNQMQSQNMPQQNNMMNSGETGMNQNAPAQQFDNESPAFVPAQQDVNKDTIQAPVQEAVEVNQPVMNEAEQVNEVVESNQASTEEIAQVQSPVENVQESTEVVQNEEKQEENQADGAN